MVLKIKSVGIGVMKGWNDLREGHTVDAHLLQNSLGRAKVSFSNFLSFAVISRSRKRRLWAKLTASAIHLMMGRSPRNGRVKLQRSIVCVHLSKKPYRGLE